MNPEHFDAVIIGSGQGGTPLAKATAKHGWKTAIVERRYPGGTCVNDGCTPSKTEIGSARVAWLAREGARWGVHTSRPVTVDMEKVYQRKQDLLMASRTNIAKALATTDNSTLLMGEAGFAGQQPGDGSYAIDVRMADSSGTRSITTSRVFLNTGERPRVPDNIDGLSSVPFLDSTALLELKEVPSHLLILGAGYIALEFAQMHLRFGAKVTVLERGERIAPHEDDDIAACLRDILIEDGLEIITCSDVNSLHGSAGNISMDITTDDGPVTLQGSHLLVATGRTPNVEHLHVERVGIQLKKSGHIEVNDRLETSAKNIWALGDVKGGPAFTHIAYDDFRVLRTNLLEGGACSIKDRVTNYCMFTDPELARVGINETEAKQQGREVRVAAMPMKQMARANEMGEPRGMMKALVDPDTSQILGATVLGVDGGEVAAQIQLAMMGKLPYTALREAVFAHPTRAEALNILFGSFRDGKA